MPPKPRYLSANVAEALEDLEHLAVDLADARAEHARLTADLEAVSRARRHAKDAVDTLSSQLTDVLVIAHDNGNGATLARLADAAGMTAQAIAARIEKARDT